MWRLTNGSARPEGDLCIAYCTYVWPPCMTHSDPARPAALLLQTVTVWAQCGGKYGGNRCMSKPDGSARCADAAWGWVRCPAASTCKRLNYGFWQCIPA